MAEVGDPEIGIEALCDVALARQPEPLRDVGRGDGGYARFVKAPLTKQQLARRLAARDASPVVEEIRALLHGEGAGRMVGDNHLQSPFGEHVPEAIAIVGAAERRRTFADSAEPLEITLHI